MSEQEEVREQLAALAHEQWSGWMHYMLMHWSAQSVERWQRQMQTAYADLSEQEKESDRAEADRVLALLRTVVVAEYTDVLERRGTWRRDPVPEAEMDRASCALGAERALQRVAHRLGVHDLHERARRLPREDAQP